MIQVREYIWILWDLLAVLVIVYFVRHGVYRGLLNTLIGLAGYVAALFVARYASPLLAEALYDGVVSKVLHALLTGSLEKALVEGNASAGEVAELIPTGLQRIMGGDVPEILDAALGSQAVNTIESLIEAALHDPVMSILQGFFFLLLFSLIMMVARRFSQLFYGVYKIPVIGSLNALFGGVVGAAQSALALFVLAILLRLVIQFTGGGYFWLGEQVMDNTYILRVFYNMNTLLR